MWRSAGPWQSAKSVSITFRAVSTMVFLAAFHPRALAKESSFSPLMRSTGLMPSTVPMAAAAGVQRPPFFKYFRVSTVM